MKVVVVGASGTMGSKIVGALKRNGIDVVEASGRTGANALTGEGLDAAFSGADTVIDVTNSGAFGTGDSLAFFKQAGQHLLAAAKSAGVRHYLALTVVGSDRLVENDYFRAKLVQENLIRSSGIPYTIIRSTQFFEFLAGIIDTSAVDGALKLPQLRLQPIAADEAANWIAKFCAKKATDSIVELGGPVSTLLTDLARELLTATEDNRPVVTSPDALYFGVATTLEALIPHQIAAAGRLTYHDWLSRTIYE
ncbi:NmrA family NAD(P)-binding protein [Rhizobium sp. CECT 9324]|uniref:SDR family oxidoreductase n=1 Tax=Rhizobium sp. CECT 9324 TaxID=2845820 RepID=UPI001E4D923B|nr:NmrA family NAD(P)-binding protein [Rhizobium sp. CECT 9324]CAH0340868.1 hypothetical protein RHI9324_02550 [Rhizobium sp. CECT 9324]